MKTYSIKEVSTMFDLPSSTLRYYEDLGLLTNVTHNDKNQREYDESHITRLTAIQCFKQTGLPLTKIALFFEYEEDIEKHIDEIIDLVSSHETDIIAKIKELQDGLLHIQHKVRFYTGIHEAIEKKQPWPRWEDCAKPEDC